MNTGEGVTALALTIFVSSLVVCFLTRAPGLLCTHFLWTDSEDRGSNLSPLDTCKQTAAHSVTPSCHPQISFMLQLKVKKIQKHTIWQLVRANKHGHRS